MAKFSIELWRVGFFMFGKINKGQGENELSD